MSGQTIAVDSRKQRNKSCSPFLYISVNTSQPTYATNGTSSLSLITNDPEEKEMFSMTGVLDGNQVNVVGLPGLSEAQIYDCSVNLQIHF
jgi:hypothetical protein